MDYDDSAVPSQSSWDRLKRFTASYFLFDQRGATFSGELRGGFVTFLTMSYILLVNPQILSAWIGGERGTAYPEKHTTLLNNVASSTAALCAIGTFLIGLLTNLPFAIGPGMGMNTFFAGAVLIAHTEAEYPAALHSWNIAVTTTFFAGLFIFIASMLNVTEKIIQLLPSVLKSSIVVGIGLYQAFVGLRTLNIIESDPTELLKFVSSTDWGDHGPTGTAAQILFGVTMLLTASMYVLDINGAILIGIGVTTVICWCASIGGVSFPTVPVQVPQFADTFWNFDFNGFFTDGVKPIGQCMSFILITLFDVAGIMFGVASMVRELSRQHGRHPHHRHHPPPHQSLPSHEDGEDEEEEDNDGKPNHIREEDALMVADDESILSRHEEVIAPWEARRSFAVVGVASMASGILGCSPCIVFLECMAGVASGARTGFSSLVTAALFFVSLPFVPLFRSVPSCASSPALVIIGCFMMSSARDIPWDDHKNAMPAFLTIAMMPFTASITPGIVIGIVSYVLLHGVHYVAEKVRNWRGMGPTTAAAEAAASPQDIEARSHRSHGSAQSHTHSLGFNVDETYDGPIGYRQRGGEQEIHKRHAQKVRASTGRQSVDDLQAEAEA